MDPVGSAEGGGNVGRGCGCGEPHFALKKPPHPTGGALGGLLQGKIGVVCGLFLAGLMGFGLHGVKIRAETCSMKKAEFNAKYKGMMPLKREYVPEPLEEAGI